MSAFAGTPGPGTRSSLIRDTTLFQESLGELLRVLRQRERGRALRYGLSVGQLRGLRVLAREGPMAVTRLGEALLLEKSTASRLAKSLLQDALVRKRSPRSDGRVVILQLTEKGHRLSRRILNELSEETMEMLGSLDPVNRQRLPGLLEELTRLLIHLPPLP